MTEEEIIQEIEEADNLHYLHLDNLQIGDWVRFYTNSTRGAGATTRLAQITGFKYSPPIKRLGIPAKRIAATAINAVDRFDEIGYVIEINPEITKGISLI